MSLVVFFHIIQLLCSFLYLSCSSTDYLASASKGVYEALIAADPDAVW